MIGLVNGTVWSESEGWISVVDVKTVRSYLLLSAWLVLLITHEVN